MEAATMTEIQEFMLTVCFGAVVGFMIGNLAFLLASAVHGIKKRLRQRKDTSTKVK